MKKNIFKSLLLTAVVSTVGIGSVCAADQDYEVQSTNVSDYSIKLIVPEMNTVKASADLEVQGLKSVADYSYYAVKFVEKDTPAPGEVLRSSTIAPATEEWNGLKRYHSLKQNTSGIISTYSLDDEVYLYNKDLYAYIYNCTKRVGYDNYCKVTTNTPIKVEKEPLPSLTQRYQMYFFGYDDTTSKHPYLATFALFPHYYTNSLSIKLNIKIGIIEDSSVISSMARNESGAVQKLYDYAKAATNGINYQVNLHREANEEPDTSNLPVQNGKYYYIYYELDDPTNQYMDLSDVAIVMAKNNMIINDVEYGDYVNDATLLNNYEYGCYACTNDYVWTVKGYQASTCQLVDSITSKGNCVKSVKTGVEDYLVPGAIVMVVGGAIVTLLSRKTKFKRI